jgi:hypothetical protein
MATYISLTHLVNNKPSPVYINVDQICWIGAPVGAAPDYKTTVMLSAGFVNVCETLEEVMKSINPPVAGAAARA